MLETTHLELDGKLFVNTQQAPTWRANCRRFETGGSLSRRVNVAACPSPDGSTRGRARRGEVRWPEMGVREVEIPRPSCSSRAQVGCACSRGLQASTRVREASGPKRAPVPVLVPARPTFSKKALVLPFIGVRRGSRCTMGGVAECYVSSGGELAPYVHAVVAAGEILAPSWCDVVAVGGAMEPGGGTAVGAVESLLTSSCFRKRAESRRRHRACGAPSLPIWRS